MTQEKIAKVSIRKTASMKASPVRLKQPTLETLSKLKSKANTGNTGRRVQNDDLVSLGLSLISDSHVKQLRESKQTNKDRFEEMFKHYKSKNRGATRDEFLGILIGQTGAAG